MAAVGTLDLASVTDALIAGLDLAIAGSPLWTVNGGPTQKFEIDVSGMPVDVARNEGDTQLALSLIHLSPNASYRTLTQRGPQGITVQANPIALNLTYALSAFAAKDYVHEQQAMSIALAWIAGNPIQRFPVSAVPPHQIECTVTIETETLDEMARLWQALSGALRLTALLKVGVVFLGPDPVPLVAVGKPTRMGVLVAPEIPAAGPRLLAISEPVTIATGGANEAPLAPGETAIVAGLALNGPEKLFLSPVDDSSKTDVTSWVVSRGTNSLHLKLPTGAAAPPAGPPAPGVYRLRIGSGGPADPWIVVEIGA